MRRLFLAALTATSFATCVHAQSNAAGPLVTPSGKLQFVRVDGDFVGMLAAHDVALLQIAFISCGSN